jgi:hypothetical protein
MYDVESILYEAHFMHGRRKVAKDIVNMIMDYVDSQNGGAMNQDMKVEARARGVSEQSIKLSERIGKALGFDVMPLTPAACEVYEWVAEQEAKGQKIETFAAWAKGKDRIDYIRMYRKDASNIKIDWPRAFVSSVGIETDYV